MQVGSSLFQNQGLKRSFWHVSQDDTWSMDDRYSFHYRKCAFRAVSEKKYNSKFS